MARSPGGVYSLPPGSTITNGDTSDATDVNTPLQDLETDMNTPRPIVAGGTGASSAASARTNLGLPYGVSPQNSTATLTASISTKLITVDATAGDVTLTLPAAADMDEIPSVRILRVDTSANSVTLDGNAAETINGQTTIGLPHGQFFDLQSDGSNWHTLDKLSGRIASGEVSSSVSEIVFALPSNYREVVFDWYAAELSVAGAQLLMQVGTGTVSSPSWKISDYRDIFLQTETATITAGVNTIAAAIISPALATGFESQGSARLSGFAATTGIISSRSVGVQSGTPDENQLLIRDCRLDSGGPFTVMRIVPSTGTLDALFWTLTGVE